MALPGTDMPPLPRTDKAPPGTASAPSGTAYLGAPGTDTAPPRTDRVPPGTASAPPGTAMAPSGSNVVPSGTALMLPGTAWCSLEQTRPHQNRHNSPWNSLGAPWNSLGALWSRHGAPWNSLGAPWNSVGAPWNSLVLLEQTQPPQNRHGAPWNSLALPRMATSPHPSCAALGTCPYVVSVYLCQQGQPHKRPQLSPPQRAPLLRLWISFFPGGVLAPVLAQPRCLDTCPRHPGHRAGHPCLWPLGPCPRKQPGLGLSF
ncbi:PREDICTED: LOW QUALITY PROTEIN: exonuclease mut-7 homolog [Rhinopithecus bieti]|uniref:LOW QUALITY PROTEIN: exonuclease mut-7 homolog n=1 Tax=Rhinopithecus bieti TaxID=61621 RepID=UPI00083C4EF1|nr:PREDICTED: LOW QUALITY PROTEIN: exonuclease mut-7 homolog [Rhinopithecus bieti]